MVRPASPPAATQRPAVEDIHRPSCLIAEDQALIGMALEAYLEEMGFAACETLGSSVEALAWLDRQTPELAVIDFMLKDGPSTALARELRRRGVPFVVYSGRSRSADLPPEFDGAPWIEKPADREILVTALNAVAPKDHQPVP